MKRIIVICSLIVLVIWTLSDVLAKDSNTVILKRGLIGLNIEHPEDDLQKNIDRKDFRFVCICGYACYAPGIGKDNVKLSERYGLKCIEGTNDVLESEEHGKLMQVAKNYAETYNMLLLGILKAKKEP
jgi:outer membrane lipoprotein LolB